jgi:uncharacterized membrane protein YedE/YeeE
MRSVLLSFAAGVVFALGLGVSGMTDPQNVAAFLDVTGEWDPSLAFVMIGAIGVHAWAWAWTRRRARPVWGSRFRVPGSAPVDRRLVLGASLFGVGWGLSGVCPGPGIVAASTLDARWLLFVAAMIAGMVLHRFVRDGVAVTERASR